MKYIISMLVYQNKQANKKNLVVFFKKEISTENLALKKREKETITYLGEDSLKH